jgi:hypothetical protein
MAATIYESIPDELWQQGLPSSMSTVLLRWETLPAQDSKTYYQYAICVYFRGDWYPRPGIDALVLEYPDTVRYIVLQP